MLAYLGTKLKEEGGDSAARVVVTDLREEAVVYINGTPFVLRELSKPVDTLKHVGITGAVVCASNQTFNYNTQVSNTVLLIFCIYNAGRKHRNSAKRRYIV